MTKRKGPAEIKQNETEHLHPLIARTEYSDVMSTRTELMITIPPDIGHRDGGALQKSFLEAVEGGAFKSDTTVNSWEGIKALLDFDGYEAAYDLHPKQRGRLGPVQRAEHFSDEAFSYSAYRQIKMALDALEQFSDEQKVTVLNAVAPRFVQAGMALAEARMRQAQLENVVQGKSQLGILRKEAKKRQGLSPETKRIGAEMATLIANGKTPSEAARSLKKTQKLKHKVGTLLTYHTRYKKSLDSP